MEVCESPISVADQSIGLESVTGVQKTEFSLIGTGILKVCECPEIVKEQLNRLGRVHVYVCVCVHVSVYMYVYMAVSEFPYF